MKNIPTRKMDRKNRRTRKNICASKHLKNFESDLVCTFIQLLNTIKLYHWKTHSYPAHKASDELYQEMNENIDHFVEVLLGKCGNRIHLEKVHSIPLKDFTSEEQMVREMEKYKSYLVSLNSNPVLQSMTNSDLYNIRDEIMGNINQFLYLLTFK